MELVRLRPNLRSLRWAEGLELTSLADEGPSARGVRTPQNVPELELIQPDAPAAASSATPPRSAKVKTPDMDFAPLELAPLVDSPAEESEPSESTLADTDTDTDAGADADAVIPVLNETSLQ
jgi:hypothetical protein